MSELFKYDPYTLYGQPIWRDYNNPDGRKEAFLQTISETDGKLSGVSIALYTFDADSVPSAEETLSFTLIEAVTMETMEAAAQAVKATDGQGVRACPGCNNRRVVPHLTFFDKLKYIVCPSCKGRGVYDVP